MIKNDSGTRRVFTLTAEQASDVMTASVVGQGQNAIWMQLGDELGFIWSTVGDLFVDWETTVDDVRASGATFTAEAIVQVEDAQAVAWLDDRCKRQGVGYGTPSRDAIIAAFVAGRTAGFAMGSKAPQPANTETVTMALKIDASDAKSVVDWCERALPLLNEAAQLFRSYEMRHRAKVPREEHNARHAIPGTVKGGSLEKAERNGDIASRIEALLSDDVPESTIPAAIVTTAEHAFKAVLVSIHPNERYPVISRRDPGEAARRMFPDAAPPRTSPAGLDPEVLDAMRQAAGFGTPAEVSIADALEAKVNSEIQKAFREGVPPGHETDIVMIAHRIAPGWDVTMTMDLHGMPRVTLSRSIDPI